jgi:hypothetical protein
MKSPMNSCVALLLIVFCCVLVGCSGTTEAENSEAVAALNAWWQKTTSAQVPEKPGTVTQAHTMTVLGKPLFIPRHVQTKAEYVEQLKDFQWTTHIRSIVKGFRVSTNTVIVLTTLASNSSHELSPSDKQDARDICVQVGGFIWSGKNRHWSLENIRVLGGNGELLSSRTGLRGKIE